MPRTSARNNKRKKVSSAEEEPGSASSSDSGPEDRNPPPKTEAAKSNKSAAATASGASKNVQQSEDAEPSWNLDKQRVLKVRSWKGKTFIDIREYYEKDGKQLPGRKGISLSSTQWSKLKSIISEVDEALEAI